MRSDMWEHTAIFLTWDEWGGFYDPIVPPAVDHVGLGIRVPLLTISPYTRRGVIDDERGEFSTPLRFISDNWGLEPLTDRIGTRTTSSTSSTSRAGRGRPNPAGRQRRPTERPGIGTCRETATPAGSLGRCRSRTRSRSYDRPATVRESPDGTTLHANDVRVTRVERKGKIDSIGRRGFGFSMRIRFIALTSTISVSLRFVPEVRWITCGHTHGSDHVYAGGTRKDARHAR